jgi:hypothetical protein
VYNLHNSHPSTQCKKVLTSTTKNNEQNTLKSMKLEVTITSIRKDSLHSVEIGIIPQKLKTMLHVIHNLPRVVPVDYEHTPKKMAHQGTDRPLPPPLLELFGSR